MSTRTRVLKLNFADLEVWELAETCALDVADRGGITLEEVGAIMNLTRERIRQVEVKGLAKLEALKRHERAPRLRRRGTRRQAPPRSGKVLESLHLPVPPASRANFTLDEFLDRFAAPGSAVRVVKVHKRRTRYTIGGCMAERSDVVADGKSTRTIAIEAEDAAAVVRAVGELGLAGYTNTSYPRGLAALIDDEPERYAVIDAGTNSIKFHVGERDREGRWRTVADRAELTRLGEGLAQPGRIIDTALERAVAAIHGGEHLRDLLAGQILWVRYDQLLVPALGTALIAALPLVRRMALPPLLFYVVFALAVTASVQLVGVYLVFASLIVPGPATRNFGRRRLWIAYAVGLAGYAIGLVLSTLIDLPSGAMIVWCMTLCAILTFSFGPRARPAIEA